MGALLSTEPVPRIPRHASGRDFFRGAALPFRAVSVISRSPRLRALAAISATVTLVSLIGLLVALFAGTRPLLEWLWPRPSGLGELLWWLALVALFVVLLVVGANTLPLLALAPLQDPLSEGTERACGVEPGSPRLGEKWSALASSIGHTAVRIALLLLGHAALALLNLIIGVGTGVWTVAATLWTILWLAAEYLDVPMARHLYSFAQLRRLLIDRLALCVGFGTSVYLLLWIPILNFFFVPLAVVGGTLLFVGLRASGGLPEPQARVEPGTDRAAPGSQLQRSLP